MIDHLMTLDDIANESQRRHGVRIVSGITFKARSMSAVPRAASNALTHSSMSIPPQSGSSMAAVHTPAVQLARSFLALFRDECERRFIHHDLGDFPRWSSSPRTCRPDGIVCGASLLFEERPFQFLFLFLSQIRDHLPNVDFFLRCNFCLRNLC